MNSRKVAVLVLVFVGTICAAVAGWRTAPQPVAAVQAAACDLPASLYAPHSFFKLLDNCGVPSTTTTGTHLSDFLNLLPSASYTVTTNLGTMSAAFFPGPIEGRVTVRPVGVLSWEVLGVGDSPQRIGSNHPLYFIIHRNLFLMIDDHRLYTTMRTLLHTEE